MWDPPLQPEAAEEPESRTALETVLETYGGLQTVAALCLVVTILLPWLSWGPVDQRTTFTIDYNLLDTATFAPTTSSGWALLILAGIAIASVASLYELLQRPEGRRARMVACGGFLGTLLGAVLGLVVGTQTLSSGGLLGFRYRTTLEFGFWLGLALAGFGSAMAVAHFRTRPNPARPIEDRDLVVHRPAMFPPTVSPALPPASEHVAHSGYAEHVAAALTPDYGPAVYPTPGRLTPAYSGPGSAFPRWDMPPGASAGGSGAANPAGYITVVEGTLARPFTVQPGQRLLIGRDPDAAILVADPSVSPRHATVERRGDGWAVQDIDATNPTRLVDEWGSNRPVRGETLVDAGQLLVGNVKVYLYPGPPGRRRG
jgi:hypothetical protein